MMSDTLWRGGDRVEVIRSVSGAAVYFPATVVNKPSVRKKLIWVEHVAVTVGSSVRMKEYVLPTRLRPSPPREINRWFKAGDDVDVFRDCEGCWVRGNVTTVLEKSKYIVEFNGENRPKTEVDLFNLRPHREWEDGKWVPSLLQQSNILESTPKCNKLKIKLRRRDEYEEGDLVEVRSEEETYKGSWYCARICLSLGDDKYIVEHVKFSRDDGESIPLKDVVGAQNVRPVPPPELPTIVCYEQGDEVDVWFNKRWWMGRISKVLEMGSKYLVYLVSTGVEPIVLYPNLRPHKDWINGQWSNPSMEECYKSPHKVPKSCEREEKVLNKGMIKCRRRDEYEKGALVEECNKPPLKKLKFCERAEKKFNNGMMVEVRSYEEGYEGSWFSAKIMSYLGKNRYTVEYLTLVTDNEKELLKEEAKESDIRPIPPPLLQKRYELNEAVDAWYNEGWWSGRVYKIKDNWTRYGVYFKTSDERLQFAYNELRPCQVWINGKWSRA